MVIAMVSTGGVVVNVNTLPMRSEPCSEILLGGAERSI
jgi:hypothetical protein